MDLHEQTKNKMNLALDHLKEDLKGIRTGRANPAILDGISVDVYGTHMRIKDIANVSTPEPRQLLITPFDVQTKGPISKAIEKANLGVMPIIDGNAVRIKIPPMDDSVRKEMIKLCHERREKAKVTIRNIRRESNETARKQKNDGIIGEDILKKLEKQIQDLTDKYCKDADDITEKKEKEVSVI